MTIAHHPSEETLAAFVAGTLCEGNTLVVATHISHCPVCRRAVRDMAEVGGGLLDLGATASITPVSRASTLALLDSVPTEAPPAARGHARTRDPMAPVSLYPGGRWQWVGPGVYRRFLDVPSDAGTRVFVLKSAPGTRLPDHRHVGTEWTCVLQGAFRHDHGRFAAGDFDEADDSVDHNPYVEAGAPCICLVALNGHVEMTGWLGRVIQPLIRL